MSFEGRTNKTVHVQKEEDPPASGQEHGLLDEDGAGQQDVPAAADVVGAGREKRRRRSEHQSDVLYRGWTKK